MKTHNVGFGIDDWRTAVALGARGYVCAGDGVIRQAAAGSRSAVSEPSITSLWASTQASWIRQSGRHGTALSLDGQAAALAVEAPDGPWRTAAIADALTGLAADNLGRGRFAVSGRLLERVRDEVLPTIAPGADFEVGDRLRLRWRWVSAELGLYSGDVESAATHSAAALDLVEGIGSARHRIKTQLIGAAASAMVGNAAQALAAAGVCADETAELDLLPLNWAALTMLSGMGEPVADRLARVRNDLTARGMSL